MTGTHTSTTWRRKAAVFTVAAASAGGFAGVAFAAVGGVLSDSGRAATVLILGVGAVGIGALQLVGRRIAPPQVEKETPRVWLYHGPVRWALVNGFALGLGFTSRIGFWLWYVIPAAALLSHSLIFGGVVYGTYSLLRAGSVWAILPAWSRVGGDTVARRLVARFPAVRFVADIQLLLLGFLAIVTVGFEGAIV